MTIRIVPLGTNGFIPSFGRQTMSFLLLAENDGLLLDAGTGVARLLEEHVRLLLRPYDCLNIILSHYHLDHVIGLSYLPGIWTRGLVRIYAPGEPLLEATPEEAFNRLLQPPLFPLTLRGFPTPVEVVSLAHESVQVGALPVRLRPQKHSGGSVGIRIADSIAYITDTVVDQATVEFVRGVELLMHEVWLTDAEAETDQVGRSVHSYASGVANIAAQANVNRLMPVHHHPQRTDEDVRKLAQEMARQAGIEVVVSEEGKLYQVGQVSW